MKPITLTFVAIAFLLSGSTSLWAADCETLIKNINNQRNFLLRKQMVEDAAKECPENAILVFKYGFSLERFNKPHEALKHYKKAAELNPKMAKAFFGQGDIYKQLEQYEEAINAYNLGLEIDPTNVRAIKCRLKSEEALKEGK